MENCLGLAVRTEGTAGSVVPTIERTERPNDDEVVSQCVRLPNATDGHKFEITFKTYNNMYIFLTILIVIAAILLTLLVLVQNSKGGGLAAGFASGNQVMGAPKTADFLEKATWTLIALIVACSIAAVGFSKGQQSKGEEQSAIEVEAPAAQQPAAAEMPAETPAESAE